MPESLQRVQELTGRSVEFEEMDILDQAALQRLFKKVGAWQAGRGPPRQGLGPIKHPLTLTLRLQHNFMAVIHFAGLKAVGESVQKPLDYYRVNLTGTIQLLEVRRAARTQTPGGPSRPATPNTVEAGLEGRVGQPYHPEHMPLLTALPQSPHL